METFDTIYTRRSIRKYSETQISEKTLSQIINAGIQAPSAKNRQPWFFYIINDKETKLSFIKTIKTGIAELSLKYKQKSISRPDIEGAKESVSSMEQAQVIILVTREKKYKQSFDDGVRWDLKVADIEVTDLLSIGAAIQNMLLAATDLGLGSLWVCDIFYAYPHLKEYLQTKSPIVSAICIGKANEHPNSRLRLPLTQVSEYL